MRWEDKIIVGFKVKEKYALNNLEDEELEFECILSRKTENDIAGFKLRLLT